MVVYVANSVVKTLVIHKETCKRVKKLSPCGCGEGGEKGNSRWYCESHITINKVDRFMNGKFWAILLCDDCFREDEERLRLRQVS